MKKVIASDPFLLKLSYLTSRDDTIVFHKMATATDVSLYFYLRSFAGQLVVNGTSYSIELCN